ALLQVFVVRFSNAEQGHFHGALAIFSLPTQSTPFLSKARVLASSLPAFKWKSYGQLACGGRLMRMDSMRPLVSNPNFVPASYTKLNSTYRLRLTYCQFFCSSVNVLWRFRLTSSV